VVDLDVFGKIQGGICKDITGVGRWGNGDVEVFLDSLDQLDDVMEIIKQAFEKQDVE